MGYNAFCIKITEGLTWAKLIINHVKHGQRKFVIRISLPRSPCHQFILKPLGLNIDKHPASLIVERLKTKMVQWDE